MTVVGTVENVVHIVGFLDPVAVEIQREYRVVADGVVGVDILRHGDEIRRIVRSVDPPSVHDRETIRRFGHLLVGYQKRQT